MKMLIITNTMEISWVLFNHLFHVYFIVIFMGCAMKIVKKITVHISWPSSLVSRELSNSYWKLSVDSLTSTLIFIQQPEMHTGTLVGVGLIGGHFQVAR